MQDSKTAKIGRLESAEFRGDRSGCLPWHEPKRIRKLQLLECLQICTFGGTVPTLRSRDLERRAVWGSRSPHLCPFNLQ